MTQAYDIESFLEKLNHSLRELEVQLRDQTPVDTPPLLFVTGVPRSGTTLLTQVLLKSFDFGYISNLTARFWQTPTVGILLAKSLGLESLQTKFSSDFGGTSHVSEPHEFGRFWLSLLGYPELAQQPASFSETIDWQSVASCLRSLSSACGKPTLFKPFLLPFHAAETVKALPKSLFIHITRDPLENALSLLDIRKKKFGDINQWASLKPLAYPYLRTLDPIQQVAAQVVLLDRDYQKALNAAPQSTVLHCSYNELCSDPIRILDRVQARLSEYGGSEYHWDEGQSFQVQKPSEKYDSSTITEMKSALKKFKEQSEW